MRLAVVTIIMIVIAVMLVPSIVWLVDKAKPIIKHIIDPSVSLSVVKDELRSLGLEGVIIMFTIQVIQSLTVIIPAIAVWTLSGITYGIAGVLISAAGILVAFYFAFAISRKFDTVLLKRIEKSKRFQKNPLTNTEHPAFTVAVLCLVPGMPIGLLPYLAALTPISRSKFLVSSVPALLPKITCYALLGDRFISGNYVFSAAIAIVMASASIICLVFRDRIFKKFDKAKDKIG